MKCLCFSDSHGTAAFMRRALSMHPDCEVVFFLGDGLTDAEELVYDRRRAWFCVQGNCDYVSEMGGSFVKKLDSVTLSGYKFLFTHGNLFCVKESLEKLVARAREERCNVVLFGHTHIPYEKYLSEDNLYIFNPGSIGIPYRSKTSYGIIDITESGIIFSHGVL